MSDFMVNFKVKSGETIGIPCFFFTGHIGIWEDPWDCNISSMKVVRISPSMVGSGGQIMWISGIKSHQKSWGYFIGIPEIHQRHQLGGVYLKIANFR